MSRRRPRQRGPRARPPTLPAASRRAERRPPHPSPSPRGRTHATRLHEPRAQGDDALLPDGGCEGGVAHILLRSPRIGVACDRADNHEAAFGALDRDRRGVPPEHDEAGALTHREGRGVDSRGHRELLRGKLLQQHRELIEHAVRARGSRQDAETQPSGPRGSSEASATGFAFHCHCRPSVSRTHHSPAASPPRRRRFAELAGSPARRRRLAR